MIEYNAPEPFVFAARIDQPKITIATAEIFYWCLVYISPNVIAYLSGEHITVIGQGLPIINYYIYGLAKTY